MSKTLHKGAVMHLFPNQTSCPNLAIPALFLYGVRLNPARVPDGLSLWHVREDEENTIGTIEVPSVTVNFSGSILLPADIGIVPENGVLMDFGAVNLKDHIMRTSNLLNDAEKNGMDIDIEYYRNILEDLESEYSRYYSDMPQESLPDYTFVDLPEMIVEKFVTYLFLFSFPHDKTGKKG